MNLNIGIFGSLDFAAKLGKKGTSNDIAMFNHASSEGIFTYVCPNSEKIQTLLQVLNMIDVPVLVVKDLTKEIGEVIIGIDEMKFENGFIITETADNVRQFIKGTSLEKFEFIDEPVLRQKLLELKIDRPGDNVMVPIDNYFNVKGIGTVILGIVKSGKVMLHDKLMMEPLGKEVLIKGIQVNDRDMQEADAGTRVGLNLKNVEADEVKRGFVICKSICKANEVKIKFQKNKFFRQELKQGLQVFLSVGLQTATCSIESVGEEMLLKSVQQIAYTKGQRCIVASQNETMPRILGSGNIL